jgi:hypothetical protein
MGELVAADKNKEWRDLINVKPGTTKQYIEYLRNTLKMEIKHKNLAKEKVKELEARLNDAEKVIESDESFRAQEYFKKYGI